MQCIVWGFVFSAVTMLPVYIIESNGYYREHGVLFLDAEAPATYTVGDDLTDAVSWLVLIGPGFLIPLGVLAAGPRPRSPAPDVPYVPLAHARASKQLKLVTVAGHAQNSCYVVSLDWGRQFASSAPSADVT